VSLTFMPVFKGDCSADIAEPAAGAFAAFGGLWTNVHHFRTVTNVVSEAAANLFHPFQKCR